MSKKKVFEFANVSEASKKLGIPESTLRDRLRKNPKITRAEFGQKTGSKPVRSIAKGKSSTVKSVKAAPAGKHIVVFTLKDLHNSKHCEAVKASVRDFIKLAHTTDSLPFYIVRTYSAGVFAGNIKSRSTDGKQIVMTDAIRLWYWEGAFTLSALAHVGTTKPDSCKFAMPVNEVELTEVIEVLKCTDAAEKSIKEARIWKP